MVGYELELLLTDDVIGLQVGLARAVAVAALTRATTRAVSIVTWEAVLTECTTRVGGNIAL